MDFDFFVGTFEHTLDEKGRIVLPAKFRSHFTDGVYLTPADDCVVLRTRAEFEGMVERIQAKVRSGEVDHQLRTALGSESVNVQPDAQGRITLTARLQELASLEREIVLIGAFDTIQIYAASTWRQVEQASASVVAEAYRQGIGI
ncbi:MAG: cell division/cell wall cluster transcriptional repressor MraZ [Actinobacteria bacterium]|nr:cell division/cell wall cluster transcriptional repressor MraZ [Actinomycetota bacterium]